jgi:multiple sugar transport system permease protein
MEPSFGIFNVYLMKLGIIQQPILFLGSPDLAILSCVLVNTWRFTPFVVVITFAALQTIPEELYNAAKVDGASAFQRFRNVTLPFLTPLFTVITLIGVFWTFNSFDLIWLLTRGGPGGSTETLPITIYKIAFGQFKIGPAGAISGIMILALAVFALVYFRLVFRRE